MNESMTGIALALVLLGTGAPAGATEAPQPSIADLAWISGSWQTADGDYQEYWTDAAENALLGMARNLKDGRMVFFEYLRIERREEGIVYVAQPVGRAGTDFRLTSLDDGEAVFENPEHDFPKRIRYRRGESGTLTASIDGGPGSDKPATTFSFHRIGRRP